MTPKTLRSIAATLVALSAALSGAQTVTVRKVPPDGSFIATGVALADTGTLFGYSTGAGGYPFVYPIGGPQAGISVPSGWDHAQLTRVSQNGLYGVGIVRQAGSTTLYTGVGLTKTATGYAFDVLSVSPYPVVGANDANRNGQIAVSARYQNSTFTAGYVLGPKVSSSPRTATYVPPYSSSDTGGSAALRINDAATVLAASNSGYYLATGTGYASKTLLPTSYSNIVRGRMYNITGWIDLNNSNHALAIAEETIPAKNKLALVYSGGSFTEVTSIPYTGSLYLNDLNDQDDVCGRADLYPFAVVNGQYYALKNYFSAYPDFIPEEAVWIANRVGGKVDVLVNGHQSSGGFAGPSQTFVVTITLASP